MAKILFAQEIFFPFQSIAKLSAYLKLKGHEVDLVIGDEHRIAAYAKTSNPSLIAFSVLTPYRNHMLVSAHAIKKAGVTAPIIAGGYDITFMPQILEYSDLDIICRGEGEEALTELCDCLDNGKDYSGIANLWVKKNGVVVKNSMRTWQMDMDQMPFDDRDIYLNYDSYFSIIPFMQVLAGRGCPYPCSYCFNRGYMDIYYAEGSRGYTKLRSPDHVIAECIELRDKYKAKYIFFNDSTLTYNKRWILEFLSKYKDRVKVPFSINAVIREIDDEVGKALGDCGYCELVRFGLETGNEDFRVKILNKKLTNQQFFDCTKILQRYGIRYSMQMMLGLPGETLDNAWETIDIAHRLSTHDSVHGINLFKPFPGLEITNYGISIGQYKKEEISAFEPPDVVKQAAATKSHAGDGCGIAEGDVLVAEPDDEAAPAMKALPLGTRKMVFFSNYRSDPEGQMILRLSRFSHLAIRLPWLRPLIRQLIKLPDNAVYRFIWLATESLLNIRAHARVPISFFVQYFLHHRGKQIR